MGRRCIYLVRHGQIDPDHRPSDGGGPRLTELGREQAACVAVRLAALPLATVRSSPLRRAVETARLIVSASKGVRRQSSPLLRECIPGVPSAYPQHFAHLAAEVIAAQEQQAARAYAMLFRPSRGAPDRHEAVVCHGNIMRYFVCRALQLPTAAWASLDILNAALCMITVEADGRVMLVSHNDSGHLPLALHTYS